MTSSSRTPDAEAAALAPPSRVLPEHASLPDLRGPRGPLRALAVAASVVVAGVIGLAYLVAAPFIAMGIGLWEVVCQVRETAARPRPFVGARHGLPFLDPPPPAPAARDADEGPDPAGLT